MVLIYIFIISLTIVIVAGLLGKRKEIKRLKKWEEDAKKSIYVTWNQFD